MPWTVANEGEEISVRSGIPPPSTHLNDAYAHCLELARRHYENFPVASRFLPRSLRGPVAAIYAFARRADDFADETAFADRRLQLLDGWQEELKRSVEGGSADPVFRALADTMRRYKLPPEPFLDLLSAFRQDASRTRYQEWSEVLDYCRRSANPVGRLVLCLFGYRDPALHALSDSICTALQLTNFWQDLAVDVGRKRVYVPLSDLEHHRVPVVALLSGQAPRLPGYLSLMEEMARRTEALFEQGRELPRKVGGRLGFELRLTWLGGRRILEENRRIGFDVFARRPVLTRAARAALFCRACFGSF